MYVYKLQYANFKKFDCLSRYVEDWPEATTHALLESAPVLLEYSALCHLCTFGSTCCTVGDAVFWAQTLSRKHRTL